MEKQPKIVQMDFVDALFKQPEFADKTNKQSEQTKRKVLNKKQLSGFREDYNEAMITLYIIGALFNSKESQEEMPEEIRHNLEKAKKTQARYERYKPKAAQNIINYGRDVVDAYMSDDHDFLQSLRNEAERSKYPQKQRVYSFATRTIDRMVDVIRMNKEII